MTPRIRDIAKAANVSPSAVSLALNNRAGISAEVKQKILGIAASMGYRNMDLERPLVNENIVIRVLKIAKHGHIVNEHHNAFITEYLEGIEAGAKRRKFKLEVSFFNHISIEEIVETEQGNPADGFIILGTELNAHELQFFTALTVPMVFIDTYFPLSVYDCIDMDNADGVFRSIQYLYNCGHRNIGLVKSGYETRNFRMREVGFREAMEYFSLPVQEQSIITVDPTFNQAMLDMGKFLDKNKALPSALFCMNDIIAYGCMKALRNHGYRVPDDVSVIGFDDLPASGMTEPPLTTIRVSTSQIGRRAIERLAEKINGFNASLPENILVSGKLVVRDSVISL